MEEIHVYTNKLGPLIAAGGIDDIRALRIIVGIMQQFGMELEFYDGVGKTSVESYLKHVEKQRKWSRTIEAGGLSFRFGRLTALKHGFISMKEIRAGSAVSWAEWVKPFLVENSFVQAWVSGQCTNIYC
jgi:hypothetical protein